MGGNWREGGIISPPVFPSGLQGQCVIWMQRRGAPILLRCIKATSLERGSENVAEDEARRGGQQLLKLTQGLFDRSGI